ncbi:hypothetical protein HC174_10835 [Salinimicrobium sp. CDJ15-81-2]|nr:hypothetical protein [Salinimicrobium nanhaiense]
MYKQQKKVTATALREVNLNEHYGIVQKHQKGSGAKKTKRGKRSGYNK